MASPAGPFDVFLSFRGKDTRYSFTDHLYEALMAARINTFRDVEDFKKGEKVEVEINRIIKESRASVVVISENYANSTSCLDELALIVQQRTECNHYVLPIFYKVTTSDVGSQTNTFKITVDASKGFTEEKVKLWKSALTAVSILGGYVLEGYETPFLREIIKKIYDKLDSNLLYMPPYIIGMDTRYEEVSSWLNRPNAQFLAIWGMVGSGKTTLAKYIFNLNWKSFENVSFVEGVGSKCKTPDGMRVLQEQLLQSILSGKKRKIPNVYKGTTKIEEALQTKKSLIVLDDIEEESQLDELLGNGTIFSESKIIITTTKKKTENWLKSKNRTVQMHKMELLKYDEALELLCCHAFCSKVPREGLKQLADQAVLYCEGNPLGLKVLGSSLSCENENTISEWESQWESQLRLLEKDIDSRIEDLLIVSYNILPNKSQKDLFLHIACFFVGVDRDYVAKILEVDYSASYGIRNLCSRCLLSILPNKKLMMHRLLQEMGKKIVRQESEVPAERSRAWLSSDSYKILRNKKGSKTIKGLALDMEMLKTEKSVKSSPFKTKSLQNMDSLKLLQLKSVKLEGPFEDFSEDLRWLCWLGSHLTAIPSDLFMGNLVALDMSYSKLEIFEPPMVLQSLKILNLKDSHNLIEIRNMSMSTVPYLETLILLYCQSLVSICETIRDLENLTQLNMTGCNNLFKSKQTDMSSGLEASTSGGKVTVAKQPTFSFPPSLHWLFLKDCNLDCTDAFPLSFSDETSLKYLDLGNGLFEFLPCFDHFNNLLRLDLSLCAMLKRLLCLPSTLEKLYVYYCISLEEISFQSHRFTLQEFGYEGCTSLSEVEGFIKLVHVAKLEESDLGHTKWLKEYQNREVCLVGDDELTKGRSPCVQMLYEFNIMSTSLPHIEDPNMNPKYVSKLSSLSFAVPLSPNNRRLKGLDVTFTYTVSVDDDLVWFCKICTSNGVDLMYNPKVFGKPESGEVGIWLSHWPIGNALHTRDEVSVSIVVVRGLEVHGCGVSLVYTDDEVADETFEDNITLVEVLGGDLSRFQLRTGAYYLCRRDFFELMEVGRLTPDWFSILVGDTIEYTEVRGWRKTGRPTQLNPSFTELKFVRCIIHGPESEEIYNITEMSKSSYVDKAQTLEFTSSLTMKSSTSSESRETIIKIADHAPTVKDGKRMITGRVILQKKKVSGVNNLGTWVLDQARSFFGHISFQLISASQLDHESSEGSLGGILGNPAILTDRITTEDSAYEVSFEWNDKIGAPGALIVKNHHYSEFYLETLTLQDVPDHGQVHFVCNSWVYPSKKYVKDRIFFANKAYLPDETPQFLRYYREEELSVLRGNGLGELKEWDRVYDYAFYNDLGDPDHALDDARPVLGGSSQYPYPRRGRTGRPPTKSDPETESRIPVFDDKSLKIYVPRDERFEHLMLSDFLVSKSLVSELEALTDDEFESFEDMLRVYNEGIRLPLLVNIWKEARNELMLRIIAQIGSKRLLQVPMPQAIQEDKSAWRTDEEFAREMLAGVNPVSICLLQEFPPTSKLDFEVYGNQNSSIEPYHIEKNLDGLRIYEALKRNRLFILDHHDSIMPYVRRINATSNKIYATRTLLFLQQGGTLKPLAIELSLPHEGGDHLGAISKVYTPAEHGVESSIWQLAKAYVAVNDSGVHQLISHWLNTHCAIEPFVIATNRQLSVLHPIYKLLKPHFRNTMNINALARQILINSKGFLEATIFPGRYAMEMSSVLYKDWVFPDQALPVDLVKRGMAIEDSNSPHGLRLLIEDYPYAVDGLEIWFAIKTWVEDYCGFYYKSDYIVQSDSELQSWWKELREEGHGDKKHEPWWPKMHTRDDLWDTCTTIIWMASSLHAAVDFGQYPYAGCFSNRPTISHHLMPEPHTREYYELLENPDRVFLQTFSAKRQSLIGIALIEILSKHPKEQVYLGQGEYSKWTIGSEPLKAFEKFGLKLRDIEERIVQSRGVRKY